MDERDYIIKFENITKNYQNKKVLGPINLKIRAGERIAIIGANGSGKTTLCEMMANIKSPTRGKIKYSLPQRKLTKLLSINFQEQNYPSTLIVQDLTDFYHAVYKHNKKKSELWKTLNISPLLAKKFSNLSGGQKQRLNLYLSLFHRPQIFIGDEITTGLDIQTKIEVIKLLQRQTNEQQTTLILVSHHWDEITSLCSLVILLNRGLLIDDTTPSVIQKHYGSLLDYYKVKIIK